MFWKLFNYIQGANSAEKKIPMTVPVTTKVVDSVSFTWFFLGRAICITIDQVV